MQRNVPRENKARVATATKQNNNSKGDVIHSPFDYGRKNMVNFIIVAVILIVAAIGIGSSIKHFKGQGGCCGGGGYTPKKKKLKNVKYTRTFKVDGMHCVNCKGRVEEVINDISGTAGLVDLKKGELVVSYAEDVDDETIIARLKRAGYEAVRI